MESGQFIYPDWQAPEGVFAYTTTRVGGQSAPPYDSFNIAQHVGDDPQHVERNRQQLPHSDNIVWLEQTHSARCVTAGLSGIQADASFTSLQGITCAVMTADCLPILVCDRQATAVAAIHAGWRGLAQGIVENTIGQLPCAASQLLAWIGPAIGPTKFEVGEDVVSAFSDFSEAFVASDKPGKYFANLAAIAQQKLSVSGVSNIVQSGFCTYSREDLFFSHRRSTHLGEASTGRMVSGICLL